MLKVVPTEKVYEASFFAEKLGVSSSTLRNYKSQFTKAGMTFKNHKGKTIYTNDDLVLFNKMLSLHKQGGRTIKDCVLVVLSAQDNQDSMNNTVLNHQDSLVIKDNFDGQPHQKESSATTNQYHEIIKRLDKQEKDIKKFKSQIERRDRQITELIRQIQELKKEVATKKRWWKFWINPKSYSFKNE